MSADIHRLLLGCKSNIGSSDNRVPMWTGIGGELVFYNDVFYNDRVEIYGEKNNFQGCDGDPKNCIFDNPFFRKETQKRWKNYD
jgi:hypothetical protein